MISFLIAYAQYYAFTIVVGLIITGVLIYWYIQFKREKRNG